MNILIKIKKYNSLLIYELQAAIPLPRSMEQTSTQTSNQRHTDTYRIHYIMVRCVLLNCIHLYFEVKL